MNQWNKRPRRAPLVLLGAIFAAAYFAFHAVYGTHGLQARARHVERLEILQREIAVLEAVRSRLGQDVAALQAEPPHPDAVEEAARAQLGLVRRGDAIVLRRR